LSDPGGCYQNTLACSPTACVIDTDCPGPDQYCDAPVGLCGGEGVCASIPMACLGLSDPVCGCDGSTYSNACYAAQVGVSILHTGACP